MKPPIPPCEPDRLATLHSYDVLDTEAEQCFDDLTALASHICGTPIALVSLVDAERQWFKSRVGLDAAETPRDLAFCAYAILDDGVLEVANALEDPRFAQNPLVTGAPDIRFYAGAPLKAPDGHNLGTLCVIDRTPRALTADEREALQMLARQVVSQLELRKRLKDLHELSLTLVRARQEAERASVAKSEFLASMSHELRTPLNAIIGFTDGLLQRVEQHPLTDYQQNRVGRVQRAGQHLLGLINDILDIAKVEADKLEITPTSFDLSSLLAEITDLAEPLIAHTDGRVAFELDIATDLPPVRTDRCKLKQILVNLVSNAAKFTESGSIRLSGRRIESTVAIAVTDTGIGVPAAHAAQVFDKFHQVRGLGHHGGTGLGLALCRELSRLLGGSIAMDSVEGAGSTFTVTIPIEIDPAMAARAA